MKKLGAENIWQESGPPTAKVLECLGCGLGTGERPMGVIELMHPRGGPVDLGDQGGLCLSAQAQATSRWLAFAVFNMNKNAFLDEERLRKSRPRKSRESPTEPQGCRSKLK